MDVQVVCPYCGVGCGLMLKIENGKAVGVSPCKEHPVSKGTLCIKGATADKIIDHPLRLKYPLIKKQGRLVKASMGEAIDLIAKNFKRIIDTYGANSIGVIASAKCTNEENYLFQKFAMIALKTNNVDNSTRLCHAPSVSSLFESLGSGAMSNSYDDIEKADCILILGSNPAVTQPVAFRRILEAKKHGGKIITIDVRNTETAKQSDIFAQINPGTDIFFVAGLIKIIVENGLENKKFIEERTKGYGEFLNSIKKLSLDEISDATGVPEEKIKEIALEYSKKNSAIVIGMGITQHSIGMENVLAISDLALLTGNIGRSGTGLNPLRGCNNVQGSCDMGCVPNILPGYRTFTEENIRHLESLWDAEKLPIEKGMTQCEMIDAVPEEILGMYIIGENPLVSLPNITSVEENLKNLEFLVVQDIFLTETAALADIVLPSACFAEKTGTFTNSERRVQLSKKAVEAQGEAKADWVFIKLLAEKMGYGRFFNYKDSKEIFEEIRKVIPQYSGIVYEKLEKHGIQWPCDKESPEGTKFLFENKFNTTDGKAVFYPIAHRKTEANKEYPFFLISCRLLEHYNTGTMTMNIDSLREVSPEAVVEINPKDAKKMNIGDSERVKIISEFGDLIAKVEFNNGVKQGVLVIPNHYAVVRVNRLVGNALDPVSKIPAFKDCKVRIEKLRS